MMNIDAKVGARVWRLLLGLGGLLFGCTAPAEPLSLPQLLPQAVMLAKVAWLSQPAPLGQVAAVSDTVDDVVVYSDGGAAYYASGVLEASDSSVRGWRAAAVVPALGYVGSWLLSVDANGRLYRMRDRSLLEEVTDRYGLTGQQVSAIAVASPSAVVLVLQSQLAVVDGQKLDRYDLKLPGVVAGGGRVAGLYGDGVLVVDLAQGSRQHLPLPGVSSVAFDSSGQLWAASRQALYRQSASGQPLLPVYQSPAEQPLGELAATPSGLWLAIGDSLAVVHDGQLLVGQPGLRSAAARLVGSASGDVWLLDNGQLSRVGEESGGGADQRFWRQQLLPISNRLCQSCHQPGGSARLDLSTYSAWASRRALIEQRVLAKVPSPMPPAGAGSLTASEQSVLRSWVGRMLPAS